MYKDTNKDFEKLDKLIKVLPPFCNEYMKTRELRLSSKTMLSYAHDFYIFFMYMICNNSVYKDYKPKDFQISDLNKLTVDDITEFIHNQRSQDLTDSTVYRRLSSISTLYEYLLKRQKVSHNPVSLIEREKQKKKKIIRLEDDESERFLSTIEYGYGLNERQQSNKIIRIRDMAIFVLFLNTGLRISELRGIDVNDLNFDKCFIGIIRKGGNYQKIYFSDSTSKILQNYLSVRNSFMNLDMSQEDAQALFLSNRGTRISVRQIEVLTKKYISVSIPEKSGTITPHKLRSTFATDYYEITGDLLGLQGILGHSNIQTTTVYADSSENARRDARNIIDKKRVYGDTIK